jgi:glutathione S-transferase
MVPMELERAAPSMRLFISRTSPFARMVRMLLHEQGKSSEVVEIVVDPFQDPPALLELNPIGKVPVLLHETGVYLDSRSICAFLAPEPKTVQELAWESLAQAGMESALARVLGDRRANPDLAEFQRLEQRILRVVCALGALPSLPPPFKGMNVVCCAIAAFLAYLDFRLPHLSWRACNPQAASWLAEVSQRPAFQSTRPD